MFLQFHVFLLTRVDFVLFKQADGVPLFLVQSKQKQNEFNFEMFY